MASSSVSLDDIDNDFEKNSRRSRIRTARARAHSRLESGGERSIAACPSGIGPAGLDSVPPLETLNVDRASGDTREGTDYRSSLGHSVAVSDNIDGANGRIVGHSHGAGIPGTSSGDGVLAGRGISMLHLRGIQPNNLERDPGGASQRNAYSADRIVSTDRTGTQAVFIPSAISGGISGCIPEGHETSPKPGILRTGKDKSSVRTKLHHINKGTSNIYNI